jgi:homoserine kinase
MIKKVKVKVPATTANMGSGFDVFGMALSLYNEIEVTFNTKAEALKVAISGEGKDTLPKNEKNVVIQAMLETFKILKCENKFPLNKMKIVFKNNIPMCSGMGSSAAAITAGIISAYGLCGKKLDKQQVTDIALKFEGHPDNVVPAVYGGLCVSVKEDGGKIKVTKLPEPKLKAVAITPYFELSTKHSRRVIPKSVPIEDVVYNMSRTALLAYAFTSHNYSLLKTATQDKLHQPFRANLIPSMNGMIETAYAHGALGTFLSGSGPTIVAFCKTKDAKRIAAAMVKFWKQDGVMLRQNILDVDKHGARIV